MNTTETTINPISDWPCLLAAKTRRMTDQETKVLMTLLMAKPAEAEEIFNKIKGELALKIILARLVEAGFGLALVDLKVILWCSSLCKAPGEAVMWAFTIAKRMKGGAYTLDDWIMKDFPMGVPTEESLGLIWDQQKGSAFGLTMDNTIDKIDWWPKND